MRVALQRRSANARLETRLGAARYDIAAAAARVPDALKARSGTFFFK